MTRQDEVLARLGELMVARYGTDFSDEFVSDNPETARHAAEEFGDIVYHQGDVYPASLAAVPDMVAALEFAADAAREHLLFMLGGVASAIIAPGAGEDLIRQCSVAVIERWNAMEKLLEDPAKNVRMAALIVLTDLARLHHPSARFGTAPPPFVGALPPGMGGEALAARLSLAIDRVANHFDSAWRSNCDYALSCLDGSGLPPQERPDIHRDWAILEREFT